MVQQPCVLGDWLVNTAALWAERRRDLNLRQEVPVNAAGIFCRLVGRCRFLYSRNPTGLGIHHIYASVDLGLTNW